MSTGRAIDSLVEYCIRKGLIQPTERTWAFNTILDILRLDGCEPVSYTHLDVYKRQDERRRAQQPERHPGVPPPASPSLHGSTPSL